MPTTSTAYALAMLHRHASNSLASILAMAINGSIRMVRQVPCLQLPPALASAARWIAQKALQALRALAEWEGIGQG